MHGIRLRSSVHEGVNKNNDFCYITVDTVAIPYNIHIKYVLPLTNGN